ncbi:MAG: sialidase, partial [Prosthecobacter sp.]
MKRLISCSLIALTVHAAEPMSPSLTPPEWAGKMGEYRSPLLFKDGREVKTAEEWQQRRAEILTDWHSLMGEWPPVIAQPKIEVVETTH